MINQHKLRNTYMEEKNSILEEAMQVLARVYQRILKINLTSDTFIEIKSCESENPEGNGYTGSASGCLHDFALSGQILEEDVQPFLQFTNLDNMRAHFRSSGSSMRLRYRRKIKGDFRWVLLELLKADDYADDCQKVILYIKDIHDNYVQELEAYRELEYYCNYDPMTEIGNYYAFRSVCRLCSAKLKEQRVGIVFSDINGLKVINDTRGHEKGNEYICSFVEKMRRHFPEQNCYRISGDEFLVVSIDEPEEEFARRAKAFRELINSDFIPTASVGWFWAQTKDIESVMETAEDRMYKEKKLFYQAHPELKRNVVEASYQSTMTKLISVLTDSYEILMIIDLEKDSYHIMKQNRTSVNAGEPEDGVYSRRNDFFCDSFVAEEDCENRRETGCIGNLKAKLKEKERIACVYRLKNGMWRESTFWKMDSRSGEPAKVIYYSQNVDR